MKFMTRPKHAQFVLMDFYSQLTKDNVCQLKQLLIVCLILWTNVFTVMKTPYFNIKSTIRIFSMKELMTSLDWTSTKFLITLEVTQFITKNFVLKPLFQIVLNLKIIRLVVSVRVGISYKTICVRKIPKISSLIVRTTNHQRSVLNV